MEEKLKSSAGKKHSAVSAKLKIPIAISEDRGKKKAKAKSGESRSNLMVTRADSVRHASWCKKMQG